MADRLYPDDEAEKVFTLAASGDVWLCGPELQVVDTPQFQRLAGVKQLGTSNYVFRTAVHTRFEHSLGTLHMAERILFHAAGSLEHLSPEERREARQLARLGALLHDLPHVPFGHTLEDEFGLLPRHDKDPVRWRRLVGEGELHDVLLAGLGEETYNELQKVLQAKSDDEIAGLKYPFVADVVGNTVCADLLDYIVRDLQSCGMAVALGERFLSYFVVTRKRLGVGLDVDSSRMALRLDKRGMPRPDVESEVVKLLMYRYELAERVYFHHAKNAASVMIGRGVQELGLIPPAPQQGADERSLPFVFLPDGTPLSDDLLLHFLANPKMAEAAGLPVTGDLVHRGRAERLGQDLLRRRLFKLGYLGVHDDLAHLVETIASRYGEPNARIELEDTLAAELGLEAGDVLVHIPAKRMMVKPAEVRVERPDGTVTTLENWDRAHSNRIDALNDAHARLWRVMVFIRPDPQDPDATEKRRRQLSAAAADVFGAPSRYVPRGPAHTPVGWHESKHIEGMSRLHAEIARELAVERDLTTADVEAAIPDATAAIAGFRAAPTVAQLHGAWSAALADPAHEAEPPQLEGQLDLQSDANQDG